MAYVNPPTFVSATTATAADVNILGADIAYLYGVAQGVTFSGTQIRRTATQSIPNATWTAITWQTEAGGFDYGGWWTSGTNVVVPAGAIPAGYTTIALQVIARTNFASNSTGWRGVRIVLNGTATEKAAGSGIGGGDVTEVSAFDFIVVGAGDIITAEAYQNSGGALNISATDTKLTVVRYAPVA